MNNAPTKIVRVRPRLATSETRPDDDLNAAIRRRLGPSETTEKSAPRHSEGAWSTRRILMLTAAVLGILAVLQGGIAMSRSNAPAPSTTPITSVAGDAVQSILQISAGGTLNAAIFTEEFGEKLTSGSESFLGGLDSSGYRVNGGPIASGTLTLSDDTATVLVATTGDIRDSSGQAVSTHTLSFEVELTRESDSWLVSSMEVIS